MSAFSEFLESLGRIMGKPVVPRGEDGPIVAAERELGGRALLHWSDSMPIPYEARGREHDRRRGRVDGTFHGVSFTVWFPAQDTQPAGHVWVLATWTAERSGTHRPEVLAACRTCSDAALAAGGRGTIVGPASCVLAASVQPTPGWPDETEVWREPIDPAAFRREYLNGWPPAGPEDHGDPWPPADRRD